ELLAQEHGSNRLQPRVVVEAFRQYHRRIRVDRTRDLEQQLREALGSVRFGRRSLVLHWRKRSHRRARITPRGRCDGNATACAASGSAQRLSALPPLEAPFGSPSWLRQRAISTKRPASRLRSVLTLLNSLNI